MNQQIQNQSVSLYVTVDKDPAVLNFHLTTEEKISKDSLLLRDMITVIPAIPHPSDPESNYS